MTAQTPTPPAVPGTKAGPGTPPPAPEPGNTFRDLWIDCLGDLDLATVEGIRCGLMAELAPANGLQELVAKNIAENEIDLLTLRHRRNGLLSEAGRIALEDALTPLVDARERASLVYTWHLNALKAQGRLNELGIFTDMPMNEAWQRLDPFVICLSNQIAALERRRRHLLADYERLQAAERARKKGPVEEAQILG